MVRTISKGGLIVKERRCFLSSRNCTIIPFRMGTLYVVATPIGNLEDITLRALRTLREVSLIAAEDTRKTRRLLNAHDIHTSLTSYNEANKRAKLGSLLRSLETADVALVSEAGMPGLSDPGYELIGAAITTGIAVSPIPGPSMVPTALVVSGLPVHQFTYLGFLPRSRGERRRLLSAIVDEPRTLVAFEAPHRLQDSLRDIVDLLGDRRIAVCREMTKIHEEVFRGTVNEAQKWFSLPRGEFTLVIGGKAAGTPTPETGDQLRAEVESLCRRGMRLKEAAACVAAAAGVSKKHLYDRCLPGKNDAGYLKLRIHSRGLESVKDEIYSE